MAALEQLTTKRHEQGFETEELQAQRKNTKKNSPVGIVERASNWRRKGKIPFEKTRNLVASSGIYFGGDLEIINAAQKSRLQGYNLCGEEAPSEREDSFRQCCAERESPQDPMPGPQPSTLTLLATLFFENTSFSSQARNLLQRVGYNKQGWRKGKLRGRIGSPIRTLPGGLASSVTLAKRPEAASENPPGEFYMHGSVQNTETLLQDYLISLSYLTEAE